VVDIEAVLKDLIDNFNKKAGKDEKLKSELENVTRKISVEMKDGESYNFILQNTQLTDFSKGSVSEADIKIISDTKSFEALVNREMGPMRALATGKVKIEASLEDKLRLRKLL
jgi:putative sterol carrier protein